MQKNYNIETINLIDKEVLLKGWIHVRRDMGKIAFIDLRDSTGLVQVVLVPEELDKNSKKLMEKLRPEFCVSVKGIVQKRGQKQINPNLETGAVEVLAKSFEILNESETPPFEIDKDTREYNEELRLKHRYLDLRSERMKWNLVLRNKTIKFFRDYLEKKGFTEVDTPILTKGTPEGAREYIVPSRLHLGKFYVLPQSPQQYKQLLMVAGLEKYFQIARCFRDEDQRGDRQPEFTQLDIEMSFADQESILKFVEEMFIEMAKEIVPGREITKKPFPRLIYSEAMKKYGTDKPDLRKNKESDEELAFCWIIDPPLFEYSETEKKLVSTHHPFTAPAEQDLKLLEKEPQKAKAQGYDLVLNGFEIGGGSIRIHQRELQNKIFKILGLEKKDIEERFGHLLESFKYGAPPHGGIAPGIDRLVMILANEPNIREVMPFPKTGDARDPLTGAPTEVSKERLDELGIEIKKKK